MINSFLKGAHRSREEAWEEEKWVRLVWLQKSWLNIIINAWTSLRNGLNVAWISMFQLWQTPCRILSVPLLQQNLIALLIRTDHAEQMNLIQLTNNAQATHWITHSRIMPPIQPPGSHFPTWTKFLDESIGQPYSFSFNPPAFSLQSHPQTAFSAR